MGYGCWNASGLDPDGAPKTITFDYTYTSEEDFEEGKKSGEIGRHENHLSFIQEEALDEFYAWSDGIIEAGRHLQAAGAKVNRIYTREEAERDIAWSYYRDRDQRLKPAFELSRAGVWWQEEPHMGSALCAVIAPIHYLQERHDVWDMDEAEFRRAYHMTMDAYRAAASRQADALRDYMLAYLEHNMSAVSRKHASLGSGYCRTYFKPEQILDLKTAIARLRPLSFTGSELKAWRAQQKKAIPQLGALDQRLP